MQLIKLCRVFFLFHAATSQIEELNELKVGNPLWQTEEDCKSVPVDWKHIRPGSKYIQHGQDYFRYHQNESSNFVTDICKKLNLSAPSVAHLTDWTSLQTFVRSGYTNKIFADSTGYPNPRTLFFLSDFFNRTEWTRENGSKPFALWHTDEPSSDQEHCTYMNTVTSGSTRYTALADCTCDSEFHSIMIEICMYPAGSYCFKISDEEKEADDLGQNTDALIKLGQNENYIWFLGTKQRNYFDALEYCKTKDNAQLWDKNVSISPEEERHLYGLLKPKLEELKDVYPKIYFHMYESHGGENGIRRSFGSQCTTNGTDSCMLEESLKRKGTQLHVLCLVVVDIDMPFNEEGL